MLLKFKLYSCEDYVYINPIHVAYVGPNGNGETCICVLADNLPYKVQGTVDEVAMRINEALEEM